jgi:MarR family transcriptional regulator, transcriptional regulator for hemolysin
MSGVPRRPGWSEPSVGFLLNDVARMMRKRLEQQARLSGIGLTRAQWQTLAYLARNEGINQTSLAQLLDIEPITLVRLLDRLEAQGVVERRVDPRDRRQRNLYLTALAEPALERIRALGLEVREETLAGLEEGERGQLLALLTRMKTNLQARLSGGADEQERKRRHG